QAAVASITHEAYARIIEMSYDIERAIGRAVVDEQELPVGMRLGEDGAYRVGKVSLRVQKRDADGDEHVITHEARPSSAGRPVQLVARITDPRPVIHGRILQRVHRAGRIETGIVEQRLDLVGHPGRISDRKARAAGGGD